MPVGGVRTIVKIDAEGGECDILARPEQLERVDVLLIEWHASVAPCSAAELTHTVGSGGLELVGHRNGVMRFART